MISQQVFNIKLQSLSLSSRVEKPRKAGEKINRKREFHNNRVRERERGEIQYKK